MNLAASLLALALVAQVPSAPAAAPAEAEAAPTPAPGNPVVVFETSMGTFTAELFAEKAPKTVANILAYVESGFYDGTVFHRVMPGYIIQGGGFNEALRKKPTNDPVMNEADNRVKNERGTLSMARSGPHTATSQFFVNLRNNENLNHHGKDPMNWGYAVFGRVLDGMDVVDAISQVPRGYRDGMRDVPKEAVVILKAKLKKEEESGE